MLDTLLQEYHALRMAQLGGLDVSYVLKLERLFVVRSKTQNKDPKLKDKLEIQTLQDK